MSSFNFAAAFALAIACTSIGTTWAVPAIAQSSCQTECKDGEYCNGKAAPPSCTPCLNCEDYRRESGGHSCPRSVNDCGDLQAYSLVYPDYGDQEQPDSVSGTDLVPTVNAVEGEDDGKGDEVEETDKNTDDTHFSSGLCSNYLTKILVSTGIITVIVASLICLTGRRPCPLTPGSWEWPIRRRSGQQSDAHSWNVPEGDKLGQPAVVFHGDVKSYDRNQGKLARNPYEGHDVLVALLENTLVSPPTAAPVRPQQPADPNPLGDEESTVPFESHRALA